MTIMMMVANEKRMALKARGEKLCSASLATVKLMPQISMTPIISRSVLPQRRAGAWETGRG